MLRYYRMLVALLVLLPALTLLTPLPGVHAAEPALQVNVTTIDFGDQQVGTNSGPRELIVTNLTNTTVSFRSVQWTIGDFELGQLGCSYNNGAFQVRPREVCRAAQFSFQPKRPGVQTSQVELTDAPPGTPTVVMRGNGVVPPGVPALGQDTTFLTFPLSGVGLVSAAETVTLTNYGDVALTIRSIGMTGTNASDFAQTNTCGTSLAAGANCTVKVTFTPTATGNRSAMLAVDDTAKGSPHTILLWGEGTAPESCFSQTQRCIDARFFAYWQQHGGLAINGYPISSTRYEKLEDGKVYRVQYFERVRMEYHRDQSDPKYQVQLGQFGRRILADVPNAPTATAARKDGYTYFDVTGHNVRPEFMAYWQANGGLDQFGYPLSEEFQQQLEDGKTYTVQYFERARFELHPENQPPYNVELGQFGRRICGNRCR